MIESLRTGEVHGYSGADQLVGANFCSSLLVCPLSIGPRPEDSFSTQDDALHYHNSQGYITNTPCEPFVRALSGLKIDIKQI